MENKLYAVRIGPWIEVRTHVSAPRKKGSSVKIPVKKRIYNRETGRYKTVPSEMALDTCIYEGGSVLGQMKYNSYIRLTNSIVHFDGCKLIPKRYEESILKTLGRI